MIIAPPSNHAPPAVKHNGFTLIEMAIVTIIAGILLVGAVQVYDRWVEQKKIDETHDKVAVINDAIQSYIQINSTLPCPARLNALPDDAGGTYGVQTDCTAPPPSGVTEASGRDGEPVRIGALPTRSLNLPDEYAFDGWDNRFTFAVSAHMAETPVLYRTGKGAIFMLDSSGSASTNTGYSLTTPEGTAMYVIVSHGPDGQGAYARAATAPSTLCIPASGADQQSENCDNDAYFKDTTLTSNAGNTQRFDDIVFYQMKDYTNLTAINRFIVDTFPCTVAGPGPNMFGENCATARARGSDVHISPGQDAQNGVLLYRNTFTSETDGRAIIRTTMTASTSNEGLSTAQRWEEAIHAAIVVNGTQIAEGVILNPAHTLALSDSEGFSGLIMGTYDNIVQGEDYTVEIYLFSFGNQNASPGNRSLSAGTVRHTDHSGDAKIEILEVHNL